MINYLLPLAIVLAIPCNAMDKPTQKDAPVTFCATLAGRGKFSPACTKILVAEETKTDWNIKREGLHIFDIQTGKKTHLENSTSSDLLNENTYGSSCYKFSWSPQGTLIRANYFTKVEKVVQGQYNSFRHEYEDCKIPLYVLKVWNTHGKLLYQRHHSVGVKPYFTHNDAYLLTKEREEPLIVYDALTAKKLAELDQPSYAEQRMPLDPHNEWIVQTNPKGRATTFYDYLTFLPARHISARIEKFSPDGSLFIAEEIKEYDEPTTQTCIFDPDHNKHLAYFCTVYNRLFQKMASFGTGWNSQFDISPCQKYVIAFNHEQEDYFDLESGNKKESFSRATSGNLFEFLSSDCTQKIVLASDEAHQITHVTLAQEDKPDECVQLPQALNNVYYSHIPEIIALAYYNYVHYLFNTKTKAITPCQLNLGKGLFKHKPVHFINQDGYYITKAAPRLKYVIDGKEIFDTDTGFELRRLI